MMLILHSHLFYIWRRSRNIEPSLQEFIGNGEQNVDGGSDGGEQAKVSCLQSI